MLPSVGYDMKLDSARDPARESTNLKYALEPSIKRIRYSHDRETLRVERSHVVSSSHRYNKCSNRTVHSLNQNHQFWTLHPIGQKPPVKRFSNVSADSNLPGLKVLLIPVLPSLTHRNACTQSETAV